MKKLTILLLVVVCSCRVMPVKRELRTVSQIAAIGTDNKYLKAHMKDGGVYVLNEWTFTSLDSTLLGFGAKLDINRRVVEERVMKKSQPAAVQKFKVPVSQVALIETNDPGSSISGGLTFITGVSGAITLLCLTNPKACFGSCPTFYADNGDTLTLQAEGFSTSVSPALEKNDIDMLYHAEPTSEFELVVTNEALETHSIRHANVLVLEKQEHQRVFATAKGTFHACSNFQSLESSSQELNALVARADGSEYFSLTDAHDLNTQEEILFSVPNRKNMRQGLVIGKRQTLLTTFLMYQGLSYMGRSVGYWINEVEAGNLKPQYGIFGILGGIEVFVKEETGKWIKAGEVNETGPIATDFSLIPLPQVNSDTLHLKLRMTKGMWRVDYLSLVEMQNEVNPVVVRPSSAETIRGYEQRPLGKLLDENQFLVTFPGEAFKIKYQLPTTSCDLFLDSKGYYLEWIREEWQKEQNFRQLKLMVSRPHVYLDRAAEKYKQLEPSMEETFWKSRYVQH